ncbi:A/G-specific adenine glycosylase [Thalassobacillus pellis]|uniref:A/G-specific adenine glycosylase n=1 Tax=Thalassobacillus pellis TaxID=748008 RepID=UPI00195F7207|nr:A/G-specific adenine glycosylase [Thalassobacillus pellis]MBM7553844.1 A/G-specific adenine glycosylase [Thalassobacillus pellis]
MNNNYDQLTDYLQGFDHLSFQKDLIEWFNIEQRKLPWRVSKDPYRVWVSEIMLQQTKVDTVIPYFNHFINKFPTPEALADADEQEVLKAWEGLGYYSRARNLQNAIREVVEVYGGDIPHTPKQLGDLKGVGPYTKGAILSIAFDQPEPAVDGNVMRVMARILLIDEDIAKQRTRKLFEAIIREIISKKDPSSFNQGLMELGAIVCTPKKPSCLLCPVQSHCKAYQQGMEDELPIKSKSKKQKRIPYTGVLVTNQEGKVLIQKRPENGLLANLWEFPMALLEEAPDTGSLSEWFHLNYGLTITTKPSIDKIRHVFSHLIWEIDVVPGVVEGNVSTNSRAKFVSLDELEKYPFPVSHQKIAQHLR